MSGLLALLLVGAATATAEEPAAIFDGETLAGWSGDERFWRVEDGAIVAESTDEVPCRENTFLVWEGDVQGDVLDDFVLTFEFQISGHPSANSGVQYRCGLKDDGHAFGYQADIDLAGKYRGCLYDELGRGMLCPAGRRVVLVAGEKPQTVGRFDETAPFEADGWNRYRIFASGSRLQQFVNDVPTVECIDDDREARELSGRLALQLHSGPPMRVAFRNLQLTRLVPEAATATDTRGTP